MGSVELKENKPIDKKKHFIFGGILEKFKNIKHFEVIVLVIAAVLVGIIFFSTLNLSSNNNDTGSSGLSSGLTSGSNNDTTYNSELETKLAKILSSIKGAGNVSVMIGEKNSVLVVATGASDVAVKLEIIKAVRSVLQLNSNLIEVIVGK